MSAFKKGDRVIFISTTLEGLKGTVDSVSGGRDHLGNPHYWVMADFDGRHGVFVANTQFVALSAVDRLAELA